MTVGVYLRVSTRDQKTAGQRAEIETWLAANGYDAAAVRWFEDHESGKTLKRPAFEQMQGEIFAGRIKTVVCWKLDRISRRLRDGVNLLADWCDKGVRIIIITQQIDLAGAVGRMVAALMLGLAEIELEHRAERQRAGIAVAKQRGVYTGRKKGTTRHSPARALELQAKGLQVSEIAQALGVSARTAASYLAAAKGELAKRP